MASSIADLTGRFADLLVVGGFVVWGKRPLIEKNLRKKKNRCGGKKKRNETNMMIFFKRNIVKGLFYLKRCLFNDGFFIRELRTKITPSRSRPLLPFFRGSNLQPATRAPRKLHGNLKVPGDSK